jgi:hypothetical protein
MPTTSIAPQFAARNEATTTQNGSAPLALRKSDAPAFRRRNIHPVSNTATK